jgi:uncharacterized protein (TIGR03435 family)
LSTFSFGGDNQLMPDAPDMNLVREFARTNSEAAFTELVQRHINLVYSVALRCTGDADDAQDVTQAVFIILARKIAGLREKTLLTGWLYETTRFTAARLRRTNARRHAREQEAYMQSTLNEADAADVWEKLAPHLEAAMSKLAERDRTLLVLRFFENKSGPEAAALLGIREDAAHKRVARAIEKLRKVFAQRGVTLSGAAITGAVSANSVHAAPVMLVKTISAVAVAKGAAATTSTLTLVKGALKIMAWTKAKTAIAVGVGVLLVAGTTAVTVKEIAANRGQVWQQKYDPSVVDTTPPQVTIVPALRSRSGNVDSWGTWYGKFVGVGVNSTEIVQAAYDVSLSRLIFSVPPPAGRYDFISNLPNGQAEALRQEIKRKFGLVGKREMIQTNVLVLTLRNRDVSGMNPNSDPTGQYNNVNPDSIQCVYAPMSTLVEFLENKLDAPIVDRTGLTGHFDVYVKWDGTPDGLKKAMLPQLGLELAPSRDSIEYLIMEKVN